MAKPLSKINKTTFLNNYNIVEVSNDIKTIMKSLERFNPNKHAVMIGAKKEHTFSIDQRVSRLEDRFSKIDEKLDLILTRLDNIVKLNNLKE